MSVVVQVSDLSAARISATFVCDRRIPGLEEPIGEQGYDLVRLATPRPALRRLPEEGGWHQTENCGAKPKAGHRVGRIECVCCGSGSYAKSLRACARYGPWYEQAR